MVSRKIFYLCILLGLMLIQNVLGSYSIHILILILVLLPVISAVYGVLISKCLSIVFIDVPSNLIRGEKLNLKVKLVNTSLLTVSNVCVYIKFKYNNDKTFSKIQNMIEVAGSDKLVIENVIRVNFAGELSLYCDESYIYDPLMLFKIKIRQCDEKKMIVMPVLVEPDFYALYNSIEEIEDAREYSKNKKGNDSSEIFDMRKYIPGDSLNRIHWKLSAKEDELLVKEFSQPISSSNCILVELNEGSCSEDRHNLNGIYEMAYAIGNLACAKEKHFKLAFYNMNYSELRVLDVTSSEELTEVMRLLIKERTFSSNMALKTFIASELENIDKLYYITDKIDDEILMLTDSVRSEINMYVIGDDENATNTTRLDNGVICEVDRDDIFWGLQYTTM